MVRIRSEYRTRRQIMHTRVAKAAHPKHARFIREASTRACFCLRRRKADRSPMRWAVCWTKDTVSRRALPQTNCITGPLDPPNKHASIQRQYEMKPRRINEQKVNQTPPIRHHIRTCPRRVHPRLYYAESRSLLRRSICPKFMARWRSWSAENGDKPDRAIRARSG